MQSSRSDVLLPLHNRHHRRSAPALRNTVFLGLLCTMMITKSWLFAVPNDKVHATAAHIYDLDAHGMVVPADQAEDADSFLSVRLIFMVAIVCIVGASIGCQFDQSPLKKDQHLPASLCILSGLVILFLSSGVLPLSFSKAQTGQQMVHHSDNVYAFEHNGAEYSDDSLLFSLSHGAFILIFSGVILRCWSLFRSSECMGAVQERLAVVRVITDGGFALQKLAKMPMPCVMKFAA